MTKKLSAQERYAKAFKVYQLAQKRADKLWHLAMDAYREWIEEA